MWLKKNINQKFRSKKIGGTRNQCLEETKQNELISRKHKKVCTTLNYIEHFLVLSSVVTGCISVFPSLLGIPIAITIS